MRLRTVVWTGAVVWVLVSLGTSIGAEEPGSPSSVVSAPAAVGNSASQASASVADVPGGPVARVAMSSRPSATTTPAQADPKDKSTIALQVKVLEVSLTKLRKMGMDWSAFDENAALVTMQNGQFQMSAAMTMVGTVTVACDSNGTATATTGVAGVAVSSPSRMNERSVSGLIGTGVSGWTSLGENSPFLGLLEALRQQHLADVLSQVNLTTVPGRPASLLVGGEIPVVQSNGSTASVEWKRYGTQIDLVAMMVEQAIRLEVRVRMSELDPEHGTVGPQGTTPGLRVHEVESGIEMKSGQTLLFSGLKQLRHPKAAGKDNETAEAEEEEVQTLVLIRPQLDT